MLLENYPEETEKLKRYDRFFEWISWVVLLSSLAITYLPLGLPVHRLGFNLLVVFVGVITLIAYRVMPFEKRTGKFRYSFRQKNFLLSLSDHLFATSAIFLTGGINSPFWFVYILTLIAGSLHLPAWSMVIEGIEAVVLYLLAVGFLVPYAFGYYEVGLTASMVVVPLVSVLAVILNYVVAKGLSQEVVENRKLVADLKEKAAEAIGERDELNTVVSSVSDGIFVLDRERNLSFINKAAKKILGVKEDQVLNKKFAEMFTILDLENKEIPQEQLFPIKGVAEDEIILGPKDLKIRPSSGKESLVRLTATEIKEGAKLGIGSICVFQDLSQEKKLEEMRLDFVSIAAHELRTPITAIRGYLSILIEEVAGKLAPEERSWLEKAFVSTSNLSSLVENLLAVSRIELRTLKLELTKCNWREILQGVVDDFKQQATQKGVNLQLKVAGGLSKIAVDRFRISEVVTNLLSNAIEHTQPGGSVEVNAYFEGDQIVTNVKDTGEGIPKDALPHLFTKFFRVSGVLEEGSKGTGLGLYISKAIVEMHQGKIWVESELGLGSKFSFSLPVKRSFVRPKTGILVKSAYKP